MNFRFNWIILLAAIIGLILIWAAPDYQTFSATQRILGSLLWSIVSTLLILPKNRKS